MARDSAGKTVEAGRKATRCGRETIQFLFERVGNGCVLRMRQYCRVVARNVVVVVEVVAVVVMDRR